LGDTIQIINWDSYYEFYKRANSSERVPKIEVMA